MQLRTLGKVPRYLTRFWVVKFIGPLKLRLAKDSKASFCKRTLRSLLISQTFSSFDVPPPSCSSTQPHFEIAWTELFTILRLYPRAFTLPTARSSRQPEVGRRVLHKRFESEGIAQVAVNLGTSFNPLAFPDHEPEHLTSRSTHHALCSPAPISTSLPAIAARVSYHRPSITVKSQHQPDLTPNLVSLPSNPSHKSPHVHSIDHLHQHVFIRNSPGVHSRSIQDYQTNRNSFASPVREITYKIY